MKRTRIPEISRRALLTGVAALGASVAVAAPTKVLRPVARPNTNATPTPSGITDARPVLRQTAVDVIRAAGLEGKTGFVISDASTGEVLEQVDGTAARPPASVTKALTALYALETLGAEYRFSTRILASAPVVDGVLQGDLILAGGGDPTLVTDDLAALVQSLADAGVQEVQGAFQVWGGALPGVKEIEPGQLDQLSYNPALGGLNLNFNRVFFEWTRSAENYAVSMDARSETLRPVVKTARMQIVDRKGPVYTYTEGAGVDNWTVARGALGDSGSRWLPVRFPALYAGDVFHTLAQSAGIKLTRATAISDVPDAAELARHESVPLREMMREMLLYSTNLTAEAAGMTATASRGDRAKGLRTSALSMAHWARGRADINPHFEDHSGLSGQDQIAAGDMVKLLNADGVRDTLRPIMKRIPMVDGKRRAIKDFPAEVRAKTGTLNFVSTLAGYLKTGGGRELTFAIFALDPDAREASLGSLDERPAGASGFNAKAKRLQQDLLQRWAILGDLRG